MLRRSYEALALGEVANGPGLLDERTWDAMLRAQQAMVEAQQEQAKWQRRWTEADLRQRRLQIIATLSIPVAAAVWKWLLGRKNARDLGID